MQHFEKKFTEFLRPESIEPSSNPAATKSRELI